MSTLDISIAAARLSPDVIDNLLRLLRPYSVSRATEQLNELKNADRTDPYWADVDTFIEYNQTVIDEGGRATLSIESLTERNGVVHEHLSDVGRLGDFQAARVRLEAEGQPAVIVRLVASDRGVSGKIDAPETEIELLGQNIRDVLFAAVDDDRLAAQASPFKVFIGHGGDVQWKYLRQMLESRGFIVEAFESSERAGYSTLAVVDQMVRSSTVAVIVMTGEDEVAEGPLRARENVVHEVGFCQGALGIDKTIILLEEGISEPSNFAGLTQIRFARGELIEKEERILDALEQRRKAHIYQVAV